MFNDKYNNEIYNKLNTDLKKIINDYDGVMPSYIRDILNSIDNEIINKKKPNNYLISCNDIKSHIYTKNRKYTNLPNIIIELIIKKYEKLRDKRGKNPKNIAQRIQAIWKMIYKGGTWNDINCDCSRSANHRLYKILAEKEIIKKVFVDLINECNNNKLLNLTNLSADSMDCLNKYGIENVKFGHKFRNKKASRNQHLMADNIPIAHIEAAANIPDVKMFTKLIDKCPIEFKLSTKNPHYCSVDKGYGSLDNALYADKKGLRLLCPLKCNQYTKIIRHRKYIRKLNQVEKYNKHVTKINEDNEKIKKNNPKHIYKIIPTKNLPKIVTVSKYDVMMYNRMKRHNNKERYKLRFKVESFNSLMKNCARIRNRYDALSITYSATIDLAFLLIAFIRICDHIIGNDISIN